MMAVESRAMLALVGLALLAGCVTRGATNADTFTESGILGGSKATVAACNKAETSVWVEVEGRGECIRYYPAGAKAAVKHAMIYFHGDVAGRDGSGALRYVGPEVLKINEVGLLNRSESIFNIFGEPYIFFARPGTLGSSGYHGDRMSPRNLEIIDSAVDAIKAKYGLTELTLVGQSRGGSVVGALLAMRDDIRCGVVASASVALEDLAQSRGAGLPSDMTAGQIDPIDLVHEIPVDPKRTIFVVGDPDDEIVNFGSQRKYFKAVQKAGHRVQLVTAEGRGSQRHGLSTLGITIGYACAFGDSKERITDDTKTFYPERWQDWWLHIKERGASRHP